MSRRDARTARRPKDAPPIGGAQADRAAGGVGMTLAEFVAEGFPPDWDAGQRPPHGLDLAEIQRRCGAPTDCNRPLDLDRDAAAATLLRRIVEPGASLAAFPLLGVCLVWRTTGEAGRLTGIHHPSTVLALHLAGLIERRGRARFTPTALGRARARTLKGPQARRREKEAARAERDREARG